MVSRIVRISLIILAASVALSAVIIPTATFALEGNKCVTTSAQKKEISLDYIQVEIPIPGVTEEVVCYQGDAAIGTFHAVKDLGEYLAGIYQYFVSIVGILAVTMIMYAGIKWILAAGNQSRIQGAKDVMMSAIIGVVIAFCSYLLLFLLNPATVDLGRLSRTFDSLGINLTNIGIQGFTCAELPPTTPVTVTTVGLACRMGAGACDDQSTVSQAGNVGCGSVAKVSDAKDVQLSGQAKAGQLCVGTKCNNNGKCILDQCMVGFLAGTINWTGNAYVDKLWIDGFCVDGTVEKGDGNNVNEGTHFYSFADSNAPQGGSRTIVSELQNMATYSCTSHGGFAGFVLRIEVNDDEGSLPFQAGITTDDEFYVDKFGKVIEGQSGEKNPASFTEDSRRGIASSKRLYAWSDFFSSGGKVCNRGSRLGQSCTSDADCPDTGMISPPFCIAPPFVHQTPYITNLSINRQEFPSR